MTPVLGAPLGALARRALRLQSDERLAALHRGGQDEAFAEIVRRYRDPLLSFTCLMLPHASAEDVVQESLIKAERAMRTAALPDKLRPWIFRITRNTALNAIRDRKDHAELDDQLDGVAQPPELVESQDRFRTMVTAICALPEAQREALVARELGGAGHDEIAAKLGTTPTAVRGLLYRARTGVRDSVGAIFPLPVITALLGSKGTASAAGGAVGGTWLAAGGATATTWKALGAGAAVLAIGAGIAEVGPLGEEDRARAATERSSRADKSNGAAAPGSIAVSADRPAAPSPGAGNGARGSSGGSADDDDFEDDDDGSGGEDSEDRQSDRDEEAAEREEERREEAAEREEDRREEAAEAAEEAREAAEDAAEEAAEAQADRDEEAADRAEDRAERDDD